MIRPDRNKGCFWKQRTDPTEPLDFNCIRDKCAVRWAVRVAVKYNNGSKV